jgi:peptidyl-prolyl cis-trans isomerase SurA
MKKFILTICFTVFMLGCWAQNSNEVLFSVGGEAVTAAEFINTYNKNNSFSKASESELRDYLDLYINFKLKVRDGLAARIDTTALFQRELAQYKSQSAQQYMVDREVTEQLITEAMERSKMMIRASHILVNCLPNVQPKDSLAAYNKALDIRKKILAGNLTFQEAAVQFSDDPSARDEVNTTNRVQFGNKGDLGYFTAFDLIYPFETAAYKTQVGSVSMPFRTQFGYHLVWVQDKQPAISRINISQILLLDSTARYGRIEPQVEEILTFIEEALKKGEEFAKLAEIYAEEPAAKENGGVLEPFSPNRRPGDYVKQILALEKEQISAPFPSVMGWHIVKLHELVSPNVKEEELRFTVTTKIQRDSRSVKSRESLVEKLKKEHRFSDKGKKAALSFLEKNLVKETTLPSASDLLLLPDIGKLKPVATFHNKNITIQDFIKYLDRFGSIELKDQLKSFLPAQYEIFIKDYIMTYEFNNLENKYPEYKLLLNEYLHGMILFEMNNEKIWSVSLKDTAGFEAFYNKTKGNYLDSEGNPKPLEEVKSVMLTEFQNELENEWLNRLRERYPVWVNEQLFESILENK